MITFTIRILATAAVVAAAVTGLMWNDDGADGQAVAFDRVLQTVADAQSLHLQITRDGKTSQAWVRKPGQLRIDHPDGTHEIVRGTRAWLIDEPANRVSPRSAAYFEGGTFNALHLIERAEAAPTAEAMQKALADATAQRTERDENGFFVW